jgi:ATP-binding cassette, subfamily B, bacterial MsbA
MDARSDPSVWPLIIRVVREHFRPYAPRYAVAFVLMAIFAGCTAASAWLMKDVVNRIFVDQDRNAMVWIPLVIAGIFIAKGLAAYFQEVSLARIGNRLVAETQLRFFQHVLRMDAGFFQRYASADLVTFMTQRAAALREMMNLLAIGLGRDLLTLVSLMAVMVVQDPIMFAVAVVGGPLAAVGLRRLTTGIKRVADAELHSITTIVATMREAAQGIRIVKAFQLEKAMQRRMADGVGSVERLNNRMTNIQALSNPLIETFGGIAVASVVFYAGWRTLSQGQTPGEFFAFIAALLMAADPLRRLSRLQLQLAASAMGVRAMYEVLDTPASEDEAGKALMRVGRGEICLENVSFSYEPDTPVLNRLSLTARGGEVTALVGLSGSGKTTIFSLLQRFWRPDSGDVRIDGQSYDDLDLFSIRSQMALVSQDVFLFEGTIRENIAAGLEHCSEAEIEDAIRAANIDDFVKSLPNGLDTPVGELGNQISGGQRQRISIARAFLKRSPIILLDEPTSSLDSETEWSIQCALQKLMRGRTTVVIAHRISTIRDADMIHVLQAGEVAESGDHAELVARNGLYARLYKLQSADRELIAAEGHVV